MQEPPKSERKGVVGPYGPPPLTLLFGWAGSTDKNLVKYSKIYLNQVSTVAGYTMIIAIHIAVKIIGKIISQLSILI